MSTPPTRWNLRPGVALACAALFGFGMALGSCSAPETVEITLTLDPTPTVTENRIDPSPLPPPPKTLIVCLRSEPESLYRYSQEVLYGENSPDAWAVREALFDGPFENPDYTVAAVILEAMPDLASGEGAVLESVSVLEGGVYLNPETFQPELLTRGKPYLPSGCRDPECVQPYEGGSVMMDQLVVDFRLRAGLTWSDGEPMTAADSVYSFNVDSDPDTPTSKYLVDRTVSYETHSDDQGVRWVGVPGFYDPEYATNFWTPLPEHVLGELTAQALQDAPVAVEAPLGWGPYMIEERSSGVILLRKNPSYHRAQEGLPYYDRLLFRFLDATGTAAIQQLLTGECDLLGESLLSLGDLGELIRLDSQAQIRLHSTPGASITRLDLNANAPEGSNAALVFGDENLRSAVASCIDREGMLAEVLSGLGLVADSYVSPLHPAHLAVASPIEFNPQGATQRLDQIGWLDVDAQPETPRVARGVPGVRLDTALAFTLLVPNDEYHRAVADWIVRDLTACGFGVQLRHEPASVLSAGWPDGPVFGGDFEAVLWTWPDWIVPVCEMYASWEIPAVDHPFGSNALAFNDPTYDRACRQILLGPADTPAYAQALETTQVILAERAPSVPLIIAPRILATGPDICGVELTSLSRSMLWNLEAYGTGSDCE